MGDSERITIGPGDVGELRIEDLEPAKPVEPTVTKQLFCANCQADVDQLFAVRGDELIATCPACKRQLKFPAGAPVEELRKLFQAHKEANTGHVVRKSGPVEPSPVLEKLAEL